MKRVKQIILGAASLVLAGAILVGCGNSQQAAVPTEPTPPAAEATAEKATYVGSATCKACHADTAKNFAMTKHVQAFKPLSDFPTSAPLGEITIFDQVNTEKAVSTKMDLSKAKVYGVMMNDYIVAEVPKEAGFKAQYYRVAKLEKNGDKYEVLAAKEADMDKDGKMDWGASEFTCGKCHAPGIEAGSKDLGISCESCHGPGSNHVPADEKKGTMNVSSSSCLACHPTEPAKDAKTGIITTQNHYGTRNYYASAHSSNKKGCLVCHTTHDANTNGLLLKKDEPKDVCVTCHSGENFDPEQMMWKNEVDAHGHLTKDHSFGAFMYKDLGDDPATKPIEIKNQQLLDVIKKSFPKL